MKIQAFVVSCDEILYACIVEICSQSNEVVFNCLFRFFIATHARAAQKLLQMCEQVKNHLEPGLDCREGEKKKSQVFCALKSRITTRTSQSAGFSIFLLVFKCNRKSQNDRISASFTWLVTETLLRHVSTEIVQFVEMCKSYAQTVYELDYWIMIIGI
jgi:hypothetical protein